MTERYRRPGHLLPVVADDVGIVCRYPQDDVGARHRVALGDRIDRARGGSRHDGIVSRGRVDLIGCGRAAAAGDG